MTRAYSLAFKQKMIENYRTGLLWRLMRDCPYVVTGLRRARFTGGWLGPDSP